MEMTAEQRREKRKLYQREFRKSHPGYAKSIYDPQKERDRMLRRRYGITLAKYEQMLCDQNGVCAACGRAPSGTGKLSVLHVDHDHVTGELRGLLCHPCNTALGLLQDSPEVVQGLLEYING